MAAGLTIKHKRKASDFADGELAAGEMGVNTVSGAWFYSFNGTTVSRMTTARAATFLVAANDASSAMKAQADYVCDGTADEVQINAAIAALPTAGGKVLMSEGVFNIDTPVVIDRDHVVLEGMGSGTPSGATFSGGDAGDPNVNKGPTVIRLTAGFTGSYAIDTAYSASTRTTYGITIRHLNVYGQIAVATVDGIHWRSVYGGIDDVFISYMTGRGIYGDVGGDSNVGNDGPYNGYLRNLRINRCTSHGVQFDQSNTDHIWFGVDIYKCGGHGVYLNSSSGHQLHGCYIWSNIGCGVNANTWQNKFYNCRVQDNGTGGYYLAGASGDGAGFQIIGGNCRNNSVGTDNTYDGINIAPTGAIYGGIISGVDFCADDGLENTSHYKQRYGINVVNSNMNDLVIGPCSASRKGGSYAATFGTGFINDAGTNTRIISTDRAKMIRDGAILEDSRTAAGTSVYPAITTRSFRGTLATPLRTKSGDILGLFGANGGYAVDDSTTATVMTPEAASQLVNIRFRAAEDWTSTARGTYMSFWTTNTSSTSILERARIGESGQGLDFNGATVANFGIRHKNNLQVIGRNAAGSGNVNLYKLNTSDQLEMMEGFLVTDAKNIVLGTTTGTKIGTATTQKLGFFNSTPIVQPSSTSDIKTALSNLGLIASGGATPLDLNGGELTAGIVTATLAPTTSQTIATNTSGTIYGFYEIDGSLSLTIEGNGKFCII